MSVTKSSRLARVASSSTRCSDGWYGTSCVSGSAPAGCVSAAYRTTAIAARSASGPSSSAPRSSRGSSRPVASTSSASARAALYSPGAGSAAHAVLMRACSARELGLLEPGVQDLARLEPRQLVDERRHPPRRSLGGAASPRAARLAALIAHRQLRGRELARGHVEVRQPHGAALGQERQQIVRGLGLELLVVGDGPRRDDADHLALDDPLGDLGILDLLGDRDLEPALDELAEVVARGVVRHAAHRHRVLLALVAAGERQIERARHHHRVVEEHLVEVAEAEEDDAVGVRLFDLEVLPHERRVCRIRNCARHRGRMLYARRLMLALVLSGILVTTQNGTELAREAWRDDGKVVTSDITAGGQKAQLTIDRDKHTLHIDQNGAGIDVPIEPGAAALMNLHWAAYGVIAQQFNGATSPTPFRAILGPNRVIAATVTVKPTTNGARDITISVGPREVHVTVDKAGAVTHAAVPSEGIEVKSLGSAAAPPVKRKPPAGIVEQPFELDNRGAKIAGDLWLPATRPATVPVVIVIADSGPVDRDGNAGGLLRSDSYRKLAEALARKGIATMRYDKRGVGQSTLGGKVEDLTFDDFVSDAAALVSMARVNDKLSGVYLFGHSEGSLIALEVAAQTKVDGVISAAGAGRPPGELMHEQLARQLLPVDLKEFDSLLADLKAGKPLQPKAASLQRLLDPSVSKFMRGMLLTDPRPLASAYKGKLTVLQGDNDVQVTIDKDAKALAAAHRGAKLVVLHEVGHMLKHETHKGLDQPSYRDPSLPIDPGVTDAVVSTIR